MLFRNRAAIFSNLKSKPLQGKTTGWTYSQTVKTVHHFSSKLLPHRPVQCDLTSRAYIEVEMTPHLYVWNQMYSSLIVLYGWNINYNNKKPVLEGMYTAWQSTFCIWRHLRKQSLRFSFFCVFFVAKCNLLDFSITYFKASCANCTLLPHKWSFHIYTFLLKKVNIIFANCLFQNWVFSQGALSI